VIGKPEQASAQSFTLWQQATIKITCGAHCISASSRHIYMGVGFHAHSVRGELHIQQNASREIATLAARLGKAF